MALRPEMRELGAKAKEVVPGWRASHVLENSTRVAQLAAPNSFSSADTTPLTNFAVEFTEDSAFWRNLLDDDDATDNCRVKLNDFILTEWLPLRPGRFHTGEAEYARREALSNCLIRPDDATAPPPLRKAVIDGVLGRLNNSVSTYEPPFVQIFDPNGKMGMIDGGIGCIRLKPLPEQSPFRWLMGATSSGVVHEGLIVALDDYQHDRIISDVKKHGGLRCTVSGRLRFVSNDSPLLNAFGRGIPQLVLEVEQINPLAKSAKHPIRPPLVTAVVIFVSLADARQGLQASFVTFEAGRKGSVAEAATWLEQVYVREAYAGRIVTDFDEQMKRFSNATFSLSRLLNGLVNRQDARLVFREAGLSDYDSVQLESVFEGRAIFVAGDAYFANQAGAIGPNSTALNTRFDNSHSGGRR